MKTNLVYLLGTLLVLGAARSGSAQSGDAAAAFSPATSAPRASGVSFLGRMRGDGSSASGPSLGAIPAAFESAVRTPARTVVTDLSANDTTLDLGGTGACDGTCSGTCASCCRSGGYEGHIGAFGEFLFLRARDAEVAYAVPFNGPITGGAPIQVGPVGVGDMDFQSGIRAGIDFILQDCTKLSGAYTMFESSTTHQVLSQAPLAVQAIVGHPGTNSAGVVFLQADAQYDISFDLIDADLHHAVTYCEDYRLAYVVGIRLAQQEQEFQANFAGNSTMTVETDIDFYGAGLRGGLEWDRYFGSQWRFYLKGYGNLVPGEFRADYDQRQSFDGRVIDTGWKSGRLVTMWDLELGAGWTSACGTCTLDLGYVFSAWTNVVQTDEWIRAVHANSFIDMDDTMTFDGVVGRLTVTF
jgi:hypothetical protein